MPFPDYAISTDTAAGKLNETDLHAEIVAAGPYTPSFLSIDADPGGDSLTVVFDATPPAPEITTIDGVVAAHQGNMDEVCLMTIAVIPPEIALVAGPVRIGSATLDPADFIQDITNVFIRCRSIFSTNAAGASLRVVEEDPDASDDVVLKTQALGDTLGALTKGIFDTDTQLRTGVREYRLEGDLGAAGSAVIRGASVHLMEKY